MDETLEELTKLLPREWDTGMSLPPPYRGNWLYDFGTAIIFLFPSVALLVVSLRVWGRWRFGTLGIDDIFVVLAMGISIADTGALFMYQKTLYLGIHSADIPPHDEAPGRIWDYIIQILSPPVLSLVKSSVLFFHLKLVGDNPSKRHVRLAAWILNFVNLSAMGAFFFVTVFQCIPLARVWDMSAKDKDCIDRKIFDLFHNAFVIATDVAVLALPFWVFLGMRMARRLKVALLGVFFLGFIVTVISSIRLYLLARSYQPSADPTYTIAWTASTMEGNVAIVAASVPALWPVLRRWFPSAFALLENRAPRQRPHRHRSRRYDYDADGFDRRLQRPRYYHHDRFHRQRYYSRKVSGGPADPGKEMITSPASSATAVAREKLLQQQQLGRPWYGAPNRSASGGSVESTRPTVEEKETVGGAVAATAVLFLGNGIMRTTNVDVAYHDGPVPVGWGDKQEEADLEMGTIHGAGRDSFRASVRAGGRDKERR